MADKLKVRAARSLKRRRRVRGKIAGSADIPRLTVAKSLKNMYIQIIDDQRRVTLVGLGTASKEMSGKLGDAANKTERARILGEAVAELAREKGIEQVVFDRNRFRYHGRVKAAAEGARKKGLKF